MAFLGTLPESSHPVGELVTQVLEAPVPDERPWLGQMLFGHHLDLILKGWLQPSPMESPPLETSTEF